MYSTLFNILSQTNYNIVNTTNIYNFIILNLDLIPEDKKEQYIINIRFQLGMTFYNNFKLYYINKAINKDNLKYFK